MTETILLGLDGATWEVLDPLAEKGHLPNIRSLASESYTADLESIYPPTSGPAWVSMATGMNPGKTGVYYFLNRVDPETFDFQPVDRADFEGRSFWDVLNENGKSAGIFNFPVLSPPYEIDGYMISGFGADTDDGFAYPEELEEKLHSLAGGEYQTKIPFSDPKFLDRPHELAETLQTHLDGREAAIKYLLEQRPTDVFCGVVSATDWIQHYYWKYADESHSQYDPTAEEVNQLFYELWERVDELVGTVAEIADRRDARLLLISDHGFGPFEGTFYVNEWLRKEGFYQYTDSSIGTKVVRSLFPHLRRVAEPIVQQVPIFNDVAKSLGKSLKPSPTDRVDQSESAACATNKGFIHLLPESDVERSTVVDRLSSRLEAEGLDYSIYAPEDLYSGKNVHTAPDILFTIEDFEFALQAGSPADGEIFSQEPPSPNRSGGHKRDGILLVSNTEAADEERERASLLSVTPTVLHMNDVAVPEEVDGNVLPVARSSDDDVSYRDYGFHERDVDGGEGEEIREHLQDLGYV